MVHPKVEMITAAFEAKELHASRSGREVVNAIGSVVAETSATNLEGFAQEFNLNIDTLVSSLRAYAPTMNVLHRLYVGYEQALEEKMPLPAFQAEVAEYVEAYNNWSQEARSRIAAIGKNIIPAESIVYTFTLSETVLRTLQEAWQIGVRFSVLVTESRPNNDGKVTTKSLAELGVPVVISFDACMSEMIRRADLMMVGAEAILADGSVICKAGTYPSALIARQSDVPVYVFVDSLKLYADSLLGQDIPLSPLQGEDLTHAYLREPINVMGHLFDQTPAEYITAIVSELGVMHPGQAAQQIFSMPISESIVYRHKEM